MRIFKDLELVEHLGSGIPRILESYDKECFHFSDNFLRMAFPAARQVTPQVEELLQIMEGDMSRQELQETMGLADRKNFAEKYLEPALQLGLIEYTIPGKPTSRLQRYRITQKGSAYKKKA